jgi:hypothetical protein
MKGGARAPQDGAGRLDVQARGAYGAGMKRRHDAQAVQYTLRNVPKALDRALRRQARGQAKSLNDVLLEALARGAGVDGAAAVQHDLDFLFGSWVEDPVVDEALSDQREVDRALWA